MLSARFRHWSRSFAAMLLVSTVVAAGARTASHDPASAFLAEKVLTAASADQISAPCDAAITLVAGERQALEARKGRAMYPPMAQAHHYASFGHLNGYSAIDDTYAWSKAIALDLHTRFEAEGVRNPSTARSYRKLVLDPGGSEDANDLVRHFLGRPFNLDAFQRMLQGR